MVRDGHLIEREFLQWIDHPDIGEVPLPHSPIRWHGSEMAELDPFHSLGQDNDAVYGELLGLEADKLERLRDEGVI